MSRTWTAAPSSTSRATRRRARRTGPAARVPQLVPLDATHQIQLSMEEVAAVSGPAAPADTPRGQFAAILRYNYDAMSLRQGDSGAIVHDATAVLAYRYGTVPCAVHAPGRGRTGPSVCAAGAPNAAFTTGADRASSFARLKAAYARLS